MPNSFIRAIPEDRRIRNTIVPKPRYVSAEDLPTTESNSASRPVISNAADLVNNDPVLDSRAAAALLGKTYNAFRKMRQRGGGPAFFIVGKRSVLYLLSAVLKYRAERTNKR